MATIRLFNNYLRVPFLLLGLFEALIFYSSVYVGIFFRFSSLQDEVVSKTHLADPLPMAMFYTVVLMLAMVAMGQYQTQQHITPNRLPETLLRSTFSIGLGILALMILYYVFPALWIGRGVFAIAALTSYFGIVVIREVFYHTVDGNVLRRQVLVYGAGERACELVNTEKGDRDGRSYVLKGFVPINGEDIQVPSNKLLSTQEDLLALAKKYEIDEIVLAVDDRRKFFPTESLLQCKMSGIDIIDPVTFLEREQGKVNLQLLNPSWMIFADGYRRTDLKHLTGRLFDILASLTIITLVSPILLTTALLVALEGRFRHPIFYRQTRVGLEGREFQLMKFRSMKPDAEKDGKAVWASKNDNRITWVGHFIRKTRIDELPQVLNILKGDMRLVGPRPERPEFVSELAKQIPFYEHRHSVKPGLAGWAQLKYPYGATVKDAYEKLQYDLYYVKNYNLIMDFFILIQTLEIVILGKGAR